MKVRVGLDFGTYQTKACVNYQEAGQTPEFEFINFGTDSETNFFLPSILNLHGERAISVGKNSDADKSYRFFKIASAEDENFRGISGLNKSNAHYEIKRYDSLSPEIISIIYLSHTIGFIKERFNEEHSSNKSRGKKGSFFGKFFGRKSDDKPSEIDDHEFFYQIGIPTEWSAEKNRWRRRKFEQILYLANDINETESYAVIRNLPINGFIDLIKDRFESLERNLKHYKWAEIISEGKISAFPETAAGLTYLVKTGKIGEGYYLALDIGGGSSDISFFRVNTNRTFEYLASESLLIASNDLYNTYGKSHPENLSIEAVQERFETAGNGQLEMDELYIQAYRETMKRLNRKIKHIYNKRVYWHFKKTVANQKFKDQDCFVYGGGSLLHKPSHGIGNIMREINLHDQGTESLTATRTHAKIRPIKDNLDVPHRVKPDGWKKHIPLLIVPLGLSYIQPDQTYDWNDTLYKAGEGFYHIDDDPELFDIFRRRWV